MSLNNFSKYREVVLLSTNTCKSGQRESNKFVIISWYMKSGEVQLNGKLFVSTRKAAEIAGYAIDYIGQLCRGGKLETTRLGRSWYVSVDSLNAYRVSVGELSEGMSGESSSVAVMPSNQTVSPVVTRPTLEKITNGVLYSSDSRSLFPSLSKHVPQHAVPEILRDVEHVVTSASTASEHTIYESLPHSLKEKIKNAIHHARAKTSFSAESGSSLSLAPSISSKLFLSGVLVMSIGLVIVASVFQSVSGIPIYEALTAQTNASLNSTAPLSDESVGVVIENVGEQSRVARISDIQNSFSDSVVVTEDPSGTTGVITPVFKGGRSGNEFLYVLVPIIEE